MLTHANQCERPCHIQIDACAVCANNAIFNFVAVRFFVRGWGWGVREMDKNQQKSSKGSGEKKFGNHWINVHLHG